jgi:hypothetical protein
MVRICPNPVPWDQAYKLLAKYEADRPCALPSPPTPLILAGWAYSNDNEKARRWQETVAWANANGCPELVSKIPDADYYFVDNPSTYAIGPLGGPMYRPWDFGTKARPASAELEQHFRMLASKWSEIVGDELGRVTRPLAFGGQKARRLLVSADSNARPTWGGWSYLSNHESGRRTFTRFRTAINKAITPHEVDHVDFIIDDKHESQA